MTNIAANLQKIGQQTMTAATRARRDSSGIRLFPASKTKPPEAILEAHVAGYWRFGENRVQEAQNRWEVLREVADTERAVIGYLQSNKAKYVVWFATEFQTLDSLKVASELDRRLQQEGRRPEVLVQVNSSDRDQKFGLPPQEVMTFVRQLDVFDALDVRGLMALALSTDDTGRTVRYFKVMRQVQQELRDVTGKGWDELSMGISGDFELAVEYGVTCVRVGQAILGDRLDSNACWPGVKRQFPGPLTP